MKRIERYQGILHVIGWVVFIGLPLLMLPSFLWNTPEMTGIVITQLIVSVVMIVFFYYNLNRLMPALLTEQQQRRFVVGLLAGLAVVLAVKLACFFEFPPPLRHGKPRPAWPGLLSTTFTFSFITMLSALMAIVRHHAQLREQQQQAALGKVSAELAMLKLQVSPHFLFNTLNNIRWLARQKADQTEAAVVKLSQLLRYMLYQAQRDHVPLTQEIEQLNHYIDLQRMRLSDRQTVDFVVEGPVESQTVEPLLFIPFVENAFKYGLHGQEKSHIQIALHITDNALTFSVENPIFERSGTSAEESGIGIANVAQRLAMHYPGQHQLQYGPDGGRFRVRVVLLKKPVNAAAKAAYLTTAG
jgi:sensor histidine kinase YesM